MLKELKQKNKRILFLIWAAGFLTLTCSAGYILYSSITINRALNIFPFSSSMANSTRTFYGENIDMTQILPASQHYVVNSKGEDLIDIAAGFEFKLIPIKHAQLSFNTHADVLYTITPLCKVLNKV